MSEWSTSVSWAWTDGGGMGTTNTPDGCNNGPDSFVFTYSD
jgi:hypothetical protein